MKLLEKLAMERIVGREFLSSLITGFDSFDRGSDTLDTRAALLILSHALDSAMEYITDAGEFEEMENPSRAQRQARFYVRRIGNVIHDLIDRNPAPDKVPTFTSDKWMSEIRDEFLDRFIIANMLSNRGEIIIDSDGDACSPAYAAYDVVSNNLKYQYEDEEIGFTEFTAKREYLMDIYKICFLKAKP